MSRNVKRMIFALIVTSVCYGSTEYWYKSGQRALHSSGGRAAVAKLNDSSNEVQRKEAKRVIWESIGRNDELYTGEAIRTTAKADAKIILLKSGTVIHLEPDSLVVLEENANGLALDFLQGNLFVQGGDTGGKAAGDASDVTLKTGSGEIKLQSADMSLSRDQSGQVNLEVFKGQAELEQNGKKLSLAKDKSATLSEKGMAENRDRLLLLTPQAGETLLLNLARGEKMDLTWKPLATDYKITAEIGPTRGSLKKITEVLAEGNDGKISIAQKPGKWFVRLTAQSADKNKPALVSMVVPITIEPKSAPSLVSPGPETPVLRESVEEEVDFIWMNRNKMESQILEVAKDAGFKSILFKQDALDVKATQSKAKIPDGTYFWRVTGYLNSKGKTEALSSTANKIQVISNVEIKAATLVSPANHAHMPFSEAQKVGVAFKWQAPVGVKRYKILAQRTTAGGLKPVLEREQESTGANLTNVQPGHYIWQVTSLDPKGAQNKPSEGFEFEIDDVPKLGWAQAAPVIDYNFSTPTPSLVASWKSLPAAKSYRYRLSPIEIAIEESVWQTTKQDKFDTSLKEEGKYLAVVEALNAKGQVLAQSEPKTFNVKRLPLLPAPQWSQNTPPTLKTDGKGNLSLRWEEVQGAQRYLMILENADGQAVEQRPVARNAASVTRLKPGQYKVKLKAIDAYQRPGGESESKKLEVPNTSDIKAPKIKAMKVK